MYYEPESGHMSATVVKASLYVCAIAKLLVSDQ